MERSVKLTPHARAALLFAAVYLVHAPMPVSLQGDSRWTIHTALSLIHGRGGDLRAYSPAIVANQFYGIECVEADYSRRFPIYSLQECSGHLYNFYPVAVATLAVPFVAVLEASSSAARPILAPLASHRPWVRPFIAGDLAGASAIVENLIASLFTAGAVAALYLAALELLPPASALVLALVFAFGTLLWSLVSRALWAHGPSIFVNSLVLFLLVRGNYRRTTLTTVGFLLALAFFIRPTNAVPVLVIGIYLIWHLRSRAWWAVAGGLLPTVFFTLLNLRMYGAPLAPFFYPVRPGSTGLALQPALAAGLLANLFSPARGLFVFMPFFLFLLVPRVWRQRIPVLDRLRPWLCVIVVLHMLLVATHTDWWGRIELRPAISQRYPSLSDAAVVARAGLGETRPRAAVPADCFCYGGGLYPMARRYLHPRA